MTQNLPEFITPVEFAKVISKLEGTDHKPQAIYNLIRQNLLASEQREVTKTQTVISRDVAQTYLDARAARQAKKAAKVEVELNSNS
jgi:hypothetical protein